MANTKYNVYTHGGRYIKYIIYKYISRGLIIYGRHGVSVSVPILERWFGTVDDDFADLIVPKPTLYCCACIQILLGLYK